MTNANVEFKKLFNVIVIKQLGNYHAVTCTSERFKPVFEMWYSIASFRFVEYVLGGKYIVCLLFIRFFFSSFRVSVLCAFSSYFFASRTDQHTHTLWMKCGLSEADRLFEQMILPGTDAHQIHNNAHNRNCLFWAPFSISFNPQFVSTIVRMYVPISMYTRFCFYRSYTFWKGERGRDRQKCTHNHCFSL